MNDYDTLKAMFTRANIVFSEEMHNSWIREENMKAIVVREGEGPNNDGYYTFYTAFLFTPNGQLAEMGAWE